MEGGGGGGVLTKESHILSFLGFVWEGAGEEIAKFLMDSFCTVLVANTRADSPAKRRIVVNGNPGLVARGCPLVVRAHHV